MRRPPGPDRPGTREIMAALGWRAAAVVAVAATVAVAALPDPRRPVLTAAATSVLVALAAVVTRSRLLGTLTLASTAATVLLAAALDASTTRPAQVVAAGVLLLAALGALEHAEAGTGAGTALRATPVRRHGPAVLAVAASCLVAATAAQDVVPSVGLVLAGLVTAVGALLVTTRAHRDEPVRDVRESLSGRVPQRPER